MADMASWAPGFATAMQDLVSTLDSQETPWMDAIPATPSQGGDSWTWPVHYLGNSSTESFSENDAVSAAGKELTAIAEIAYSVGFKRTIFSITGHAKAAALGSYWNQELLNAEGAMKAHLHAQENALVSQYEAALSNTGSYGGLLRSTYKLASYSASMAGADLAMSDINTGYNTLIAHPISMNVSSAIVMSPPDTKSQYLAVAAGTGAGDLKALDNTAGTTMDGGLFKFTAAYNGSPWVDIPTMSAGGLTFQDPANIKRVVHRTMEIEPLAKVNDTQHFSIVDAQIAVVENPRKAMKLIN